MEKKFVNLTPHTINEVVSGMAFEPSGTIARVAVEYMPAGEAAGVPLFEAVYGEVEGLPAPEADTIYIVSGAVKAAPGIADREDVVAPGDLVRNEAGQPIGCRGFKVKV